MYNLEALFLSVHFTRQERVIHRSFTAHPLGLNVRIGGVGLEGGELLRERVRDGLRIFELDRKGD